MTRRLLVAMPRHRRRRRHHRLVERHRTTPNRNQLRDQQRQLLLPTRITIHPQHATDPIRDHQHRTTRTAGHAEIRPVHQHHRARGTILNRYLRRIRPRPRDIPQTGHDLSQLRLILDERHIRQRSTTRPNRPHRHRQIPQLSSQRVDQPLTIGRHVGQWLVSARRVTRRGSSISCAHHESQPATIRRTREDGTHCADQLRRRGFEGRSPFDHDGCVRTGGRF